MPAVSNHYKEVRNGGQDEAMPDTSSPRRWTDVAPSPRIIIVVARWKRAVPWHALLVPKLRLGTVVCETLFRGLDLTGNRVSQYVRSQTEFGNEMRCEHHAGFPNLKETP